MFYGLTFTAEHSPHVVGVATDAPVRVLLVAVKAGPAVSGAAAVVLLKHLVAVVFPGSREER